MAMVNGVGKEYDITMKCGTYCKTTTSQYMLCGMQGKDTTTAGFTGYVTNAEATGLSSSITADYALGIIQSYQSANSEYMTVRLFGISRAICSASVNAGDWVKAYEGSSVTTRRGQVTAIADASSITAGIATTSSFTCILGRALNDGQTGAAISLFLNPQLYDRQFIGES